MEGQARSAVLGHYGMAETLNWPRKTSYRLKFKHFISVLTVSGKKIGRAHV
jgi:hypothetical protein